MESQRPAALVAARRGWSTSLPPSDISLRRRPAASPRRVAVSNTNRTKAPNGALVLLGRCSHTAPQFVVGQHPAARPFRNRGAAAATDQRRDELGAGGVPAQQSPQRGEHTISPHRSIVVGNMIENAGVLAARDLGDRLAAQDAGAEQIEIALCAGSACAAGGPRGADIRRQWRSGCRIRPPALPGAGAVSRLPGCDRSWPWPGATPWWPVHGPLPGTAAYPVSGVVSDSATPRSVRHGPRVSLRCRPR